MSEAIVVATPFRGACCLGVRQLEVGGRFGCGLLTLDGFIDGTGMLGAVTTKCLLQLHDDAVRRGGL